MSKCTLLSCISKKNKYFKDEISRGWGCSSVVEHLPSTCEALRSILSTTLKIKLSKDIVSIYN